jgi:hypothetical protein
MTGLLCGAGRGGQGHGRANLRTSPGKHPGLSLASTTAVSPARWQGSGKRARPGPAR